MNFLGKEIQLRRCLFRERGEVAWEADSEGSPMEGGAMSRVLEIN